MGKLPRIPFSQLLGNLSLDCGKYYLNNGLSLCHSSGADCADRESNCLAFDPAYFVAPKEELSQVAEDHGVYRFLVGGSGCSGPYRE